MAIKVKLRTKQISGNRQSLYLDYYPAVRDSKTGKLTRREFLGRFLDNEIEHQAEKYVDETGKQQIRFVPVLDKKGEPKKAKLSPVQKNYNRETLQFAEQVRQKRDNELNKPEIYSGYEKDQLKIKEREEQSFIEYQVRIDFEHHNFQIENFKVKKVNDKIEVVEPSLGYSNLLEEVQILYERILDLIEVLMVFFFGVKAHQKTNGFMTLFRREQFDYSNLLYKYTVLPNMDQQGLTRLII
jgi:hypothetical protein